MRKRSAFIFLLLFLHFSIKSQVNTGDSLALVDFYNSTNGIGWKKNTNWLKSRVSEWFGVSVTGTRVTQLSLINNQLDGMLPPSLGNLTAITGIFLSNNNIGGNIPVSLGNIPNLYYLYLSNNRIEGNIPNELGNATNLSEVHLNHNKLTGPIPESLRRLTRLSELMLDHNQLTGSISGGLGDIQVKILNFSYNQLSGTIPDRLARIRNLTELRLNNNQLTGEIPAGLAPVVCHLFDLSSNQLTGSIPSDLSVNSSLVHVNLSNNALTGEIPSSLGNMPGLQSLELDSNQLTGSIPSSFNKLNRLVRLNLMNNQLSGSIPDGLCSLSDLEFLQLTNNQFTFDGMECVGQKDNTSLFANYTYQDQKTLTLNHTNSELSVTAGGTLANNTYYFYKDSVLVETLKGDSALPVWEGGKYWVEVTNDKADKLTLYSNSIDVSSNIILPLQWLGFTAVDCSGNACLQWETENEQNTSHFEIEKSTDGNNFTKIGTQASYNSPGRHSYNTTDRTPVAGSNFYRIKQVDADGTYTYSNIASIRIKATGMLTIVPNPANNFIMLRGISKARNVSIYNTAGQLLNQWNNVNGNQQLNITNLQQGIYIIKVLQNNEETTHKLVKQ
ncbi:T9SS type A sorting domain-containing protein [Agriterribacter sp.]|uniref:T9SS type A sorting domain-containing protein n=1 Tax=Agriterribacter sp. TaxID=2821509 RepID=UPI002CC267BF|nr:T9SS type A sorting domain-containing protein [Agriterribacter sp.]HRO47719.1 T9SS type A sorting domain-containing protein [Agriterribacter sp.]HRQ19428.1 T9SS type A sorting domain-containing protein [Agriterribacter sp.]